MASAASFKRQDANYVIHREGQAVIVRLRADHCRLRYHMFTKFDYWVKFDIGSSLILGQV